MLYLGNFFGVVAIILFICCYQLKTRRKIIVCNTMSRCFYVLQYLCLGAYSGAILDAIAAVISAIVTKKDTNNKKFMIISISVLYVLIIGVSIYFYTNIFSVFSFFGVTFELMAFLFTKEKHIRIVSLAAAPFWLIYNFAYMAWSSALGNIFVIISIIISIYRYDFKKQK